MAFSFREMLLQMIGHGKKEKSVFASEREAIEFCEKAYRETGGVTPELRKVYEFYQTNYHDDCPPAAGHR